MKEHQNNIDQGIEYAVYIDGLSFPVTEVKTEREAEIYVKAFMDNGVEAAYKKRRVFKK